VIEDGVVLKALKSYRLKLNRDYKQVDELMKGDYLTPLMSIRSEFQSVVLSGKRDVKTLDRMSELAKEEKRLEASFKKSNSMATSNRWVKLSLELEEINGAIAGEESKQRRRRH
jgi:hypothetical protein